MLGRGPDGPLRCYSLSCSLVALPWLQVRALVLAQLQDHREEENGPEHPQSGQSGTKGVKYLGSFPDKGVGQ